MIRIGRNTTSLLFALLLALCTVASADAQVYGGRAIGVSATVTPSGGSAATSVFADTGDLSSVGGIRTASATSASVAGVMTTGALTASTSGALKSSQSVVVADDVDITVGGYRITANQVITNAGCICCPEGDPDLGACSGNTAVGNLVVTNTATGAQTGYTVTGANQVVQLDGFGTLIINEQVEAEGGGGITVNGLHVEGTVANGTSYDIIVGNTRSSLQCLTLVPSAGEVTMTGRVTTNRGAAISNATVTATDGRGNARSTTTDKQGYYSISLLDAGATYFVTASYRRYTFEPVTVTPDADVVVNLVAN